MHALIHRRRTDPDMILRHAGYPASILLLSGSVNNDKKLNVSQKSEEHVNELNNFYNRFDCLAFSQEHEQMRNMLAATSAQEDEETLQTVRASVPLYSSTVSGKSFLKWLFAATQGQLVHGPCQSGFKQCRMCALGPYNVRTHCMGPAHPSVGIYVTSLGFPQDGH